MARIDEDYGELIRKNSAQLGVNPAEIAALFARESQGNAFVDVEGTSRPPIRFEVHYFYDYYTNKGKNAAKVAQFNKFFGFGSGSQRSGGHRWRSSESGSWTSLHTHRDFKKDQPDEYGAYELAKSFDADAATRATSFGIGQVMGDSFKQAGLNSPEELAESFSQGPGPQIDGTFAFIKNKAKGKLLAALQTKSYAEVAYYYNGSKPGSKANNDYVASLTSGIDAYEKVASDRGADPADPDTRPTIQGSSPELQGSAPHLQGDLGLGRQLLENAELHSARFSLGSGAESPDPLERMGYRHPKLLSDISAPDLPEPADRRQSKFSKGARKASTGLTVVGVGAAAVKMGLTTAGGYGGAVAGLGLAGGILGLLNFGTKIADGTLNDPLAEQTMLLHADRLGEFGSWLKRNEGMVKKATVASNYLGAAAGAASVAAGALTLSGVGLPVAAVLGGIALGLTVASVLLNPTGVATVGLKVYDGLMAAGHWAGDKAGEAWEGLKAAGRWAGHKWLQALDYAKEGGRWVLKAGGKAMDFAAEKASKAWDWTKRAAGGALNFLKEKAGNAKDFLVAHRGDLVTRGVGAIGGGLIGGLIAGPMGAMAGAAAGAALMGRGKYANDGDLTGPFTIDGSPIEQEPNAAITAGAGLFVNGIATPLADHIANAQQLAIAERKPIVGIYNATGIPKRGNFLSKGLGYAKDVGQSLGDKVFDATQNPATERLVGLLKRHGAEKREAKDFPEGKSDLGRLRIYAHSQGSIIVSEALRQARKAGDNLKNYEVTTFGNAAFTMPKGATYHHYAHDKDIMPGYLGSNSFISKAMNKTPIGRWMQGDLADIKGDTTTLHSDQSTLGSHSLGGNDGYISRLAEFRQAEAAKSTSVGKVQRRSPEAGPEPNAATVHPEIFADAGRPVDTHLAARLGMDVAGANLHADPASAKAARSMGADAFTIGSDVFFGAGKFDPHSERGMGLLAHELTHVVQQRSNDARFYTPSGGDAMEQEAQAAERSFARRNGPNLSVDQIQLELDLGIQSHEQRLANLTTLAIEMAGEELGDERGEVETLSLDLLLDMEEMSDADILDILRREILRALNAAKGPETAHAAIQRKPSAVPAVPQVPVAAHEAWHVVQQKKGAEGGNDIALPPPSGPIGAHEAWHVVQQKKGEGTPATPASDSRPAHEAWHVVQQKKSVPINDDAGLEHEADIVGGRVVAGSPIHEIAHVAQRKPGEGATTPPAQSAVANRTGMPDNLKLGIEQLSGMSMADVQVHFNSGKPAQMQALAYAQGTDIHVAPGQEQHLPHEAWHVVQQKQGRVQPTLQMKSGVPVNDDSGLETEADVMGQKALMNSASTTSEAFRQASLPKEFIQFKFKRKYEEIEGRREGVKVKDRRFGEEDLYVERRKAPKVARRRHWQSARQGSEDMDATPTQSISGTYDVDELKTTQHSLQDGMLHEHHMHALDIANQIDDFYNESEDTLILHDKLNTIRGIRGIALAGLGTENARVEFQINPLYRYKIPSGKIIYRMIGEEKITKVEHTTQTLAFSQMFKSKGIDFHVNFSTTVGQQMIASPLGPDHLLGSNTSNEHEQKELMEHLMNAGNTAVGNPLKYIKGHLLNEHVGGVGESRNLFPITADANAKHLSYVEKFIKSQLENKYVVYYEVAAEKGNSLHHGDGKFSIDSNFNFKWHLLDAQGQPLNKVHIGQVQSKYGSIGPAPLDLSEYTEYKKVNRSKSTPALIPQKNQLQFPTVGSSSTLTGLSPIPPGMTFVPFVGYYGGGVTIPKDVPDWSGKKLLVDPVTNGFYIKIPDEEVPASFKTGSIAIVDLGSGRARIPISLITRNVGQDTEIYF